MPKHLLGNPDLAYIIIGFSQIYIKRVKIFSGQLVVFSIPDP